MHLISLSGLLSRAPFTTPSVVLATALALVVLALPSPLPAQEKDDKKAASAKETQGEKPAPVRVDAVRSEPLHQTVPVIGRLVARQTGPVAARISGPVREIRVDVGDRVEADAIIAVLVKDSLERKLELRKARVAEAVAAIKTVRAQAALLSQELKRLEKLRKSAAFSQARLDDKRQELVMAQSAIAEAKAALMSTQAESKLAKIDLYDADIRAPYAGAVTQRHTEAGAFVSAGGAVVTLIGDKNLEIEADVPSRRIAGLVPGTPVTFRFDTPHIFDAVVRAVVPEENALTHTRRVRFIPRFSAPRAGLAANQSVTLSLPAGPPRDVVTVHKDAILNLKGKTMAFVAESGTASIRPLNLGEAVGGRFEVLGGIAPGTLVIVRGNERLRPGQKISYDGDGAAR